MFFRVYWVLDVDAKSVHFRGKTIVPTAKSDLGPIGKCPHLGNVFCRRSLYGASTFLVPANKISFGVGCF